MGEKMTNMSSQLYSTWVWGNLPDVLTEVILGMCGGR